MRDYRSFAICIVLALGSLLSLVSAQEYGSLTGGWNYFFLSSDDVDIQLSESLDAEGTLEGPVSIHFGCEGEEMYSGFEGLEYAVFEDPDSISILFLTEDGIQELELMPSDEPGSVLVDSDYLQTWIDYMRPGGGLPNSAYGPELQIQVTAGFYERTHKFTVFFSDEVSDTLTCF
jgi:hypothetical protein